MSIKELKAKSRDELLKTIDDLKAELFMLRFKNATGQLTQVHKIDAVRKEIARIFTVLNLKKETATPVKAAPKTKEAK